MTPSADRKTIATYLREHIGAKPSIHRYWNEEDRASIDLLNVPDRPVRGVTSYCTIGLSESTTGLTVNDVPLRAELLMVGDSRVSSIANILATCAFTAINDGVPVRPGAILKNVVGMYRADGSMQHVMLVSPFLWDIETWRLPTKLAAWLLAVPISDREHRFQVSEGSDVLEALFEREQIDIFRLNRASVL